MRHAADRGQRDRQDQRHDPETEALPHESVVPCGERVPRATTICCSASCRRTRRSTAPSRRCSTFSRNESTSASSYSSPNSLRACRVASSSFLSSASPPASLPVMPFTLGSDGPRGAGDSPPVESAAPPRGTSGPTPAGQALGEEGDQAGVEVNRAAATCAAVKASCRPGSRPGPRPPAPVRCGRPSPRAPPGYGAPRA